MVIDVGAGILLALWGMNHFAIPFTASWIALGIFAALFPDLDTLTRFLPRGNIIRRVIGEHRGLLHRPLFYTIIFPFVFFALGRAIGTLFALGILYHLIHDTFFLGWGIKWLWPFSQKSLSLFHDKDGRLTKEILWWGPEEDERIESTYRTDHWVRAFYFTVNPISISEYGALIIALILLAIHLHFIF